ncbi:DedA family protein [Nocardioides aurantiacus]|uniref:Membrane protein DedA with SNARE-associated domain n=1 Tax=Nocardioides aurantiacus TaxID=86796 RepID=A0A3N2CPE8_9ACTN|nr:VTT domain-containing protein [Nocardioides aurantiacus]ROR89391.1 membrane protein DedA with SNARE-associated domain [Nocardioides aurantiacus]
MTVGTRRVDGLLASAIGLRAVYGLAMLPLIPLLIASHPLLLTLLSGSTVAEVALGAQVRIGAVSWPVAVLAGVPVWVLTDWLYWLAGRRWGDRALRLLVGRGRAGRGDPARAERRVEKAERAAYRFGPAGVVLAPFLPVPGPLVYAAAGTAGVRLPVFVALDVLGRLASSVLVVTLGYALGRRAVELLDLVRQYALVTTLVVVAVLVLAHVVRRRRTA